MGEGGYLTAVGGHPHSIGIGPQYAWGGGVLDGGGRAPPLDWHRLTVRVGGGLLDGGGRAPPLDWHRLTVHVGGGGTRRRWEGTPIGLS